MNSHSLDDFEADFLQFLGNLPGWPEEGWSHAGAFYAPWMCIPTLYRFEHHG
jgi:hypothetical protein